MKHFTVGFVFDPDLNHILLIHKNRPEWQKGKVNGPGGKVLDHESPYVSVSREIKEETGLAIPPEEWTPIAEILRHDYSCQFFGSIYPHKKEDAQTQTDEKVEWFSTHIMPKNAVGGLSWLVPLCMDKIRNQDIEFVSIRYRE